MTYKHHTPQMKAKIVLSALQGEKEIGELAKEYETKRTLSASGGLSFWSEPARFSRTPERQRPKRSERRSTWRSRMGRC